MKKLGTFALLIAACFNATAQQHSYAQDLANTAIKIWPDSFSVRPGNPAKWSYDQGVILKGMETIWQRTGDGKWFNYIQKQMDYFVKDDGSIKGYRPDEYNIDHVNNGKLVLTLFRVTGKEKYKKAAQLLRDQLKTHPRTKEGGFWHKKIYPWQMWLDGLYMGQPFYAEYAQVFGEDTIYNDVTRQFVLMEGHARDPKTGLLYHGWDESREQRWANKQTGLSPHVWGRALGWYGMAMVDVLDYFPENHPGRDSIIGILNRFAKAVTSVQDGRSGVWYDIPNMPNEPRNYLEASASSMLVYTLAKGVRKGYLPATYLAHAKLGYEGILKQFIKVEDGVTNLHGTVSVSGLGGNPYRDGSFDYYMSEKVIVNDPKGMGSFIKAANEMEMVPTAYLHKGKTVLLDNYFNSEWRKSSATGQQSRWHYVWDERDYDGYSTLGFLFETQGAKTKTLYEAPTEQNLKGASVYIVVDPDNEKETAKPNVITEKDAKAVSDWVKAGGVLVLLGNDSGHSNVPSMNVLSTKFGVRLNEDLSNTVEGSKFEQGAIAIPEGHSIFKTAKKIYVKELATLNVSKPAKTVLTKEGKNIIATAKYGKGTVFVIGDPWLYNEYTDGRKLPADFDNHKAAQDLVKWLLSQAKKK
ncbi:MAG TPA: glycoside hydrolase family 88 protein [Flavisolibacter sp.]|nr:glycoside hydrolase family 88 protein [Flavisolibacter sp.]